MKNRSIIKKIITTLIPNVLWIKLSFFVVMMIIITNASVTFIFTTRQLKSQRAEVKASMGRLAKQIATIRFTETEGWYVYQEFIDNIIRSDFSKDIVYIAIFNEKDSLAAFALNSHWIETGLDRPLMRSEERILIQQLSDGLVAKESQRDFEHQAVDILVGNVSLGKVDVGFSLIEFNDNLRNNLIINMILLGILALMGVVASVIVSRRITRPLNRLSKTMMNVVKGELESTPVQENGDEMDQLAETYNIMIEGLKEKRAIEDFSRNLSFTLEMDKIIRLIFDQMKILKVKNSAILLVKNTSDHLTIYRCFTPSGEVLIQQKEKVCSSLCDLICSHREPFIPDWRWDDKALEAFLQQLKLSHVSAIAPITVKENQLGYLLLGAREDETAFTSPDLEFIGNLLVPAAFSLKNIYLLEELKEQEKFKRELEIARQVQLRLLPQRMPEVDGLDIDGVCLPAEEVGGDFLDYLPISDHELAFVIADVSGKGISAAFYMAELKGMLLALSKTACSPTQLLSQINQWLYESSDRHIFATMIYAIYDIHKSTLCIVRAGHNCVIVRHCSDQEPELILPPGMGLGLTREDIFEKNLSEKTISLTPGDLVLFYTDGITEAMNSDLKEFGEEQLINTVMKGRYTSASQLKDSILKQVKQFTGDFAQHDDITLIALLKE